MDEIIELNLLQMLAAYLFIVFLLYVVYKQKTGLESEIGIATLRMTVQLVFVGFLLEVIFENPSLIVTLAVFFIMQGFAIYNIFGRVKVNINLQLKQIIAFAMVLGTTFSIMYFLLVVVGLKPWYEPRYFIPLGGMIIGNSMTGISLGAERLISGFKNNIDRVEGALMLGATVEAAARPMVTDAFKAAIIPTINSMMGMGIVFLPGMMTGQILAGLSPVTAISYQIAIMLGITGSVALTVYILTELGYRTFFNADSQVK